MDSISIRSISNINMHNTQTSPSGTRRQESKYYVAPHSLPPYPGRTKKLVITNSLSYIYTLLYTHSTICTWKYIWIYTYPAITRPWYVLYKCTPYCSSGQTSEHVLNIHIYLCMARGYEKGRGQRRTLRSTVGNRYAVMIASYRTPYTLYTYGVH